VNYPSPKGNWFSGWLFIKIEGRVKMKDLNVSLLSLLEMEKDLLNDIAFNNESASEFEKVGNLKIAKNYKDEKFRAEMRLVECRREIKRYFDFLNVNY
jgi:hypothetical protein